MKKALYLLPLLLLPMLLAAGVFQDLGFKHLGTVLPFSMAYRLQSQISSHYEGEDLQPRAWVNFYYNPNYPARLDSLTLNHYDPELDVWYAWLEAIYSYNAAGMIESTDIYGLEDGVWDLGYKLTADYDSQNRLVRIFFYGAYHDDLGNLVPYVRRDIVYGAGSTFEIYDWDAYADEYEDCYSYCRSSFQYDAQGRIIESYEHSSNDSLNWVQEHKTETTYHPQDTSTGAEYISFFSHNFPLLLINESAELPGKVLQETEYEWMSGAWSSESRRVYTYDDQIRKISLENQYSTGSEWATAYRDLFYYDAKGNLDYVLSQDSNYYEEGGFENDVRTDFTWETYTANSDLVQGPVPDLRIRAYPVPFAGNLNIIAESKSTEPLRIGIYNQRGQLVNELSGLPGTNLAWDGRDRSGKACSSGIYFLRASQGSSNATAKIVKLQ